MNRNGIAFVTAVILLGATVSAQEISGTILIKKKLTHRSVTPPVSVYQRGITVRLASAAAEDPIAYERSRVVVYLEGTISSRPPSPGTLLERPRHKRGRTGSFIAPWRPAWTKVAA